MKPGRFSLAMLDPTQRSSNRHARRNAGGARQ
jgi:hypothetical protein